MSLIPFSSSFAIDQSNAILPVGTRTRTGLARLGSFALSFGVSVAVERGTLLLYHHYPAARWL